MLTLAGIFTVALLANWIPHESPEDRRSRVAPATFLVLSLWGIWLYWADWNARRKRKRTAYEGLRQLFGRLREVWPEAPGWPVTQDPEAILRVGWQAVRWLEERHLPRSATVGIVSSCRFWMNHPAAISLNGQLLGQGEEESGFDVWADVSPGLQFLELSAGKKCWCSYFHIPAAGRWQVEVRGLKWIDALVVIQPVV